MVELDNNDFIGFGKEYLRRISLYNIYGKKYITNKMVSNFIFIGMIKLIFPNAKIINCIRDPVDTCMSCFKSCFSSGMKYVYDLTELGRYYRLYQTLMSHWDNVLPGSVFDIYYEELIANQEAQTRKLIDYCGLTWDVACLAFHKTERVVQTASFTQVKRPVYKDSVRLWKRYEKHLGPLLKALEYEHTQ